MTNRCDYCLKRLPKTFIRCQQCNEVSICPNCFSLGAEAGKHKKSHKYSVEQLPCQLRDDWSLEDELILLDLVESCGLGNWTDVSSKLGNRSPFECRIHYESMYVSGELSIIYNLSPRKEPVIPIDNDPVVEYPKLKLSNDDCIELGFMPKRDDYECEYRNSAELSVSKLRGDFLKDDLIRELAVARVDGFNECLRARHLRHVVASKLDLLTHLIPDLLHARCPKVTAANGNASAVKSQSRGCSSGDSIRRRVRLLAQRKSGIGGHGIAAATPQLPSLTHRVLDVKAPPKEEIEKQQQPPSVESLHDSGIGSSENSVRSNPSPEVETMQQQQIAGTTPISGLSHTHHGNDVFDGGDDKAVVIACGSYEDEEEETATPMKLRRDSHPVYRQRSVSYSSTPDMCSPSRLNYALSDQTRNGSSLTSKPSSKIFNTTRNQKLILLSSPTLEIPDDCCLPQHFVDSLKPLLRFLTVSEAKTLLRQLHKEHIVRQEIEQLEELREHPDAFLGNTRLAGSKLKVSPRRVDSDDEDSEDDDDSNGAVWRREQMTPIGLGAAAPLTTPQKRRRINVSLTVPRRRHHLFGGRTRSDNNRRLHASTSTRATSSRSSCKQKLVLPRPTGRPRGRPPLSNRGARCMPVRGSGRH